MCYSDLKVKCICKGKKENVYLSTEIYNKKN